MRLVVIVLSLAGCANGSGEDGGPLSRNLGGVVAGWQEGSAGLVAELFDGQDLRPIAHGTVDDSGRVFMTLPSSLDAEILTPIASVLACSDLEAEPAEARVATLFSLNVVQDGGARGAIAQASSAAATFPLPSEVGAYRVFRWYADRAASVQGTCTSAFGSHDFEHRWALDLEHGWNSVVETIVELDGGREIRESRTAPVPDGTNWYFLDAMMAAE